ncbi:ABC transporter substrate-binding protein [Pseudonocardia sp.]|uniref:ABC transporter substrate-binding protein n=1 Tax=Pseudonocardia sp. TaxID=60912 RepID=UPI003D124E6A
MLPLLVIAGCGGADGGDPAEPGVAAKPVQGGSATVITNFNFRSLDPATFVQMNVAVGPVESAIYDLLFYESFESGQVEGRLGESIKSEDSITWTVTLKPNLKFSDGTPLNAEAVRFNWARFADPALTSPAASTAAQIASTEVVDEVTLRLTLTAPNGVFDRAVAGNMSVIASPTALQQHGANFGTSPETSVGAGPFLLTEIVPNASYSFTRNPDYWDAPRPYLDTLEVQINSDPAAITNAVSAGQVQAALMFQPSDIVAAVETGLTAVPRESADISWIWLENNASGPLADRRVREALQLGLDSKTLNEVLYRGAGTVIGTRTLLPEDSPYYDVSATVPAFDPGAAQKLIDEVAAENGGPVVIRHLVTPASLREAEALQTAYSRFDNLNYRIDQVQSGDYPGKVFAGEYDVALWQCPRDFAGQYVQAYVDCFSSTSSLNAAKYSSPELDAALDTAKAAVNQEERAAAMRAAQAVIAKDLPALWSGVTLPDSSNWIIADGATGLTDAYPGGVFLSDLALAG